MRKVLQIVERNKASQGIRFANYAIDRIVVYGFFFAIGIIGVFLDEFLDISFLANIVDSIADINRFEDLLLTSSIYFLYVFLMEYFTNGRTIGKYITGTKVISTDNEKIDFQQYFIRNISRLVPFDTLSFFGNNGWHDSWSDTRVVKIKDFENAKSGELEIQNLGRKENE